MKKLICVSLTSVILICTMLSLVSCQKNPIPEGRYVYENDVTVDIPDSPYFGDYMEGTTVWENDVVVEIQDNLFLEVYMEENSKSKANFVIYEVYTYELNEDKTEITLTFEKYDYTGADDALRIINGLKQSMERDKASEDWDKLSDLYPKEGPQTYSFELGDGYFVFDGDTYTKNN